MDAQIPPNNAVSPFKRINNVVNRVISLLLLVTVVGCSGQPTEGLEDATSSGADSTSPAAHIASEHLPNLIRLHDRVFSGGLPEGEEAFRELKELGITTVISVDGMTPDVKTANRFGLQYVHLPHGYDGIPNQRVRELAKAVREFDGPIYIHCHHGKHRSPAAASVACVSAGLIPAQNAVSILELAGTNPNYKGLYDSAREATAFEDALLEELQVEFKEVQEIPPMAEAMVQMSHAYDHMKLIAAANWNSPDDHPDLDPAHEALLLQELFTELLRTEEVRHKPADFQKWLESSEAAAAELHTILAGHEQNGAEPWNPEVSQSLLSQIAADCKSCHSKYRDVPQG